MDDSAVRAMQGEYCGPASSASLDPARHVRPDAPVQDERHDVSVSTPLVPVFVGELPDEAQAPAAPARFGEQFARPHEAVRHRIEREPVVRDLEPHLAIAHRRAELDRMRRPVLVGVFDDVREQLARAEVEAVGVFRVEPGTPGELPEPLARLADRGEVVREGQPVRSRQGAPVRLRAARLVGAGLKRRRARCGRHRGRRRSERAVDPGGLEDLPTHPGGTDQDHLAASLRLGASGGEAACELPMEAMNVTPDRSIANRPAAVVVRYENCCSTFSRCPQGPAGRRARSWSDHHLGFPESCASHSPLCLGRNPAGRPLPGSGSRPRNRALTLPICSECRGKMTKR